jgi:septum formation protein
MQPLLPDLYLASASPRRQDLLKQLGVKAQPVSVCVDEARFQQEEPHHYVVRLALAKATAGLAQLNADQRSVPVLGADTAVVCAGQVLGKPEDQAQAVQMLNLLSGRTHQVLTGVALVLGENIATALSCTSVTFAALDPAQIVAYCATGEPADKAGSYGIQGYAAAFIASISGSYSGVVGLPLAETASLLIRFGVPIWQPDCSLPRLE